MDTTSVNNKIVVNGACRKDSVALCLSSLGLSEKLA